ncbi:MAG: DUF2726 domain-containing protein [Candidatus Dojkabacteria bacterium]|jgi:very-short-patch-repair endonuclease|nr:DUF2726 domain-containing protein [Candidatus Dojkabacteria bacterium]
MENFIIYLLLLLPIFLFLSFLKSLIERKKGPKTNTYKYERKEHLITKSEKEFLVTLESITKNIFYIFPQIHLPSLINHKIPGQNWKGALSHIDRKSVDYVICDKTNLKPLLVIELDDSSHQAEDRVKRDTEVERILNEAGVPLLRISHSDMNNRELIREQLLKVLSD